MAKIRPLGDRVIAKPDSKEETTRSGIIIPDTAKEKPQQGIVIAVGSGRLLDNGARSAMELHEGDHVLFAKYGGTEIILDDETYLVLRESDILAVLDCGTIFQPSWADGSFGVDRRVGKVDTTASFSAV